MYHAILLICVKWLAMLLPHSKPLYLFFEVLNCGYIYLLAFGKHPSTFLQQFHKFNAPNFTHVHLILQRVGAESCGDSDCLVEYSRRECVRLASRFIIVELSDDSRLAREIKGPSWRRNHLLRHVGDQRNVGYRYSSRDSFEVTFIIY